MDAAADTRSVTSCPPLAQSWSGSAKRADRRPACGRGPIFTLASPWRGPTRLAAGLLRSLRFYSGRLPAASLLNVKPHPHAFRRFTAS